MSTEIQVLNETFFISNESCVFTFDGCRLEWRDNSVLVSSFICVDYVHSGNCCKSKLFLFRKAAHKCKGHDTIIIHYAQCQKRNKLRLNSVKIQGENDRITVWLGLLKAALEKFSCGRPNNYMVFINPFSGRQNGVEIFKKKVKPIFDMANIDTCVVVTKNRGDFEKVICSGIDCYDAILAIGGDGTVSEIVNCLINSHMDVCPPGTDESDVVVPKITIPIAIIPCGSTDCVAYTLNGTRDTETSTLYAILGKKSYYDVCRATSHTGLTRFFVSVFTYGYLSDLIRESEKFRWMGPIRYNYAGLLTLLRSKEYYGQLDLTGEQCSRRSSRSSISSKKPVGSRKKTSKSLSLCAIPILPTVEPGPECLDERMICREASPKRKKKGKNNTLPCQAEGPKAESEPKCEPEEPKSTEEPKCEVEEQKCGEPPTCGGDVPKCDDETPRCEKEEAKCEEEVTGCEDEAPKCEDVMVVTVDVVQVCEDTFPRSVVEEGKCDVDVEEAKCDDDEDEAEPCTCAETGSASEDQPCADDPNAEAPKSDCEKPPPSGDEASACTDVIQACTNVVSQETMLSCPEAMPPANPEEKTEEQYSIKGRYFLIACANISCSSELTPNGIAPNCAPGDGNMNIVLFQPNSICDLYKIYARLTSKDRDFLLSDLPFVTIYKTKQVKINVMQKDTKDNSANCDGELFPGSIVDVKLFEGIIQFLSRRSGDPSE